MLTADNFESYIKEHSNELLMIDFYAPWCIWCRRLEPVWEATAKKLMGHHASHAPIRLAKVDCTSQQDLCKKHYVRAYPTIYLFMHGDAKPIEAWHTYRQTYIHT